MNSKSHLHFLRPSSVVRRPPFIIALLLALTLTGSSTGGSVKNPDITALISLVNAVENDPSNVAVWLEPLSGRALTSRRSEERPLMKQKGKDFQPHVLLLSVGQQVDFPNEDPFPHNVFSSSAVKRFDLGIFQSGDSRAVTFNRPGVIPIYCNIHPQMEAYIIVIKSPYHGLSNDRGEIKIKGVPPGKYRLKVWHERATAEKLEPLARQVTVTAAGTNLGAIKIDEAGYAPTPHNDKTGGNYNPYPK